MTKNEYQLLHAQDAAVVSDVNAPVVGKHTRAWISVGAMLCIVVGATYGINQDLLPAQFSVLSQASYRCPVPWESRSGRTSTDYDCVDVPTNASDWRIALCSATDACNEGYVDVEYLDVATCATVEASMHSSGQVEQDHYVKTKLGPHTLSVLFDGAARTAKEKPDAYLGVCKYRYKYSLGNGGAFQLRVVLVYKDYQGLDSLHQNSWQPIVNQLLTDSYFQAPETACRPTCQRYTYHEATQHNKLPICSPTASLDGVWLPGFEEIDGASLLEYGKFPDYQWISSGCRLDLRAIDYTLPAAERSKCFSSHTAVRLLGDSHLRWLYDTLARRLESSFSGQAPAAPIYYKDVEKGNTFGNLTITYHWDAKAETYMSHGPQTNYTHFVLGFAQHMMHEQIDRYRTHIDTTLANTQRDLPESAKVVWFSSPAFPHRMDQGVITHNDTRTNPRLSQMNDYAADIYSKAGHSVQDNFAITLPFVHDHETPDQTHYFGTQAMEVMVSMLVHYLDLCNTKS